MEYLFGILIILFLLYLYFLPTLIAQRKRNISAIFAVNLFLRWTVSGWVEALVWALKVETPHNQTEG